jgi:hypothetical protein
MRASSRREAMVLASKWVFGVLGAMVLIFVFGLICYVNYEQREDCRLKGGTWFAHEGKCLDVKEIK